MESREQQGPNEGELNRTLEWLRGGLGPRVKTKAAIAATEVALRRALGGLPIGTLDAETIADQADAGGNGPEGARRWINSQGVVELFGNRLEQQMSWLRGRDPYVTHAVTLIERPGGGRGHRKTYEFVRVSIEGGDPPLTSLPPERPSPAEQVVETDDPKGAPNRERIKYDMDFCDRESMTWWARLIFGSDGVERGSWRWKLLAGRFIFFVLFVGTMIALTILLPLLTKAKLPWIFLILIVGLVTFIYLNDVRPWVRIVDDRIRMAGDSLVSDLRPTQVEIWRDGDRSTWRLVRYTSTCPICSATVDVLPGEPDFPRRLVGRCAESPREHVYSFDRVTRLGKALIAPPV